MKKFTLYCSRLIGVTAALLLCLNTVSAQTVTVGAGTSTGRFPISAYFGYERSASLYQSSEVGTSGSIERLAWYATITGGSRPIKVYLVETAATSLTADTWANLIAGATLVFDNTLTPTIGWNTVTLSSPFSYSGTNNLLVLVETNYGGGGDGSSSSGNAVQYSTAAARHQQWNADTNPPSTNGTVNSNRPNIQIGFPLPSCSGTPDGGTATLSSSVGASSSVFTAQSTGFTEASNLSFQWQSSPDQSSWTNVNLATSSSSSITAEATATTTYYRLAVTCANSSETSYSDTVSYTTISNTVNVPANSNNSVSCGTNTILYDNGGPSGNYADNSDGYTVLGAGSVDAVITISGNYSTESGWDYVGIYDGVGTGTLIQEFTGAGSINYTGSPGQTLTIRFDSDGGGSGSGFALAVTYTGTCFVLCSGTPNADSVAVSPASAEAGSSYSVSSNNYTEGVGITYQWQSNTNGGGWVNEGSVLSSYASLSGTAAALGTVVEYRLIVNCSASSQSDTSNTASFTSGYCNPTANVDDDATGITNVTLGSLSNSSDGVPAYTDYTSIPASVYIGETYPFSVRVNTEGNWTVNVLAWVDWDQDGDFADEIALNLGSAVNVTDGATSASPLSVFIPSVTPGAYRVRVRAVFADTPTPCGDQDYSEAEDYLLNIVMPPAPTISSFTPASGCENTASVAITGTGFIGVSAVTIGGTPVASYTVTDSAHITAVVGAGTTGSVVITNAGGTGTSSTNFTVNPAPVVAGISGGAATFCQGSSTTFTNSTAGGVWSVVNGTGSASVSATGVVTGTTAGTVTVNYTVTTNGCPTTVDTTITVTPTPASAPNYTLNDTVCKGSTSSNLVAALLAPVTEFSGSTTGGPTYVRSSGGTVYSASGPVIYNTHVFTVSVSGSYTFDQCAPGYDGHASLYQGNFNPASPATNFLIADDDGNVAPCTDDSRITTTLIAGNTYILVSAAFSNGDAGPYSWTISGPGTVLAPGGTITWFNATTGGDSLAVGTSFNPIGVANSGVDASASVPGTYTFYAQISYAQCTFPTRTPVSLVVEGAAPVAQSVTNCINTSATLNASGVGTLTWFDVDTNVVGSGSSYTTASLSANTTFFVRDSTSNGCLSDLVSVVVTMATPPAPITQTVTLCAGESITIGTNTYNSNGTHIDTIPSVFGCDSFLTTTIVVLPNSAFSQTIALCAGETYTIGSHTYSADGTYIDTISSANGCDSVVTTTISVTTLNNAVSVSGNTGVSLEASASWQWIGCIDNQPVNGANAQTFTPTVDGDYKVAVSKNGCADTSNCVNLVKSGIDNIAWANALAIYPNPSNGVVNIAISNINAQELFITITDVQGRVIYQSNEKITSSSFNTSVNLSDASKGVYLVKLNTGVDAVVRQLILN